ncbi:MAG: acetyltransferase [Bacteroidia bacterium]
MKSLIIIGSGGFARECIWLLSQINAHRPMWKLRGIVAPEAPDWNNDIPYLGTDESVMNNQKDHCCFVVAIGDPKIRQGICHKFEQAGFQPINLIHPQVSVAPSVQIGLGSIICAGVQLTVNLTIGRHCIVNLNTTIGHEAQIGDFCTLSPGSNISGAVELGNNCFLGSGVNVLPGRKIISHSTIGAGAVVTNHLEQSGVYVGIPAKLTS